MGFLDFCNALYDKASQKLQQMQEEYEKYCERYAEKDDETLVRYFKRSSSIAEKNAIATILRDRGYNANNINEDDEF